MGSISIYSKTDVFFYNASPANAPGQPWRRWLSSPTSDSMDFCIRVDSCDPKRLSVLKKIHIFGPLLNYGCIDLSSFQYSFASRQNTIKSQYLMQSYVHLPLLIHSHEKRPLINDLTPGEICLQRHEGLLLKTFLTQ